MRQIRSKAYRKLMAMYSTSFGFRQPYQVLGASCAVPCQLAASPSQKTEILTYLLPWLFSLSIISGL